MHNHLVVTAVAPNQAGIANKITAVVNECGCNILQSTMRTLGENFALVLLVKGEWNAVAKLEHKLPQKTADLDMALTLERTTLPEPRPELPYRVKVIALDDPGISDKITAFFSEQGINIRDLDSTTYPAPQTGAMIGDIRLTLNISKHQSVVKLRESFARFCEKENLDGVINPLGQQEC